MTGFRVLVADKVKAQLYELPARRAALRPVQAFVNPAGMQPERALGASRPGRVPSRTGGRQTYAPRQGLREHADDVFVKQVAAAVAADAAANDGCALVVVAAPRLLGAYRRERPDAVRGRIAAELRLDLTKLPVAELGRRVRAAIGPVPIAVTARLKPARRPARR